MMDASTTPIKQLTRFTLPPSPISPNGASHTGDECPLPVPSWPTELLTPPHELHWSIQHDERPSKRLRTNNWVCEDDYADIEREIDDETLDFLQNNDETSAGPLLHFEASSPDHYQDCGSSIPEWGDTAVVTGISYEDQALDTVLANDFGHDVDATASQTNDFQAIESENDEVCFGMIGPIAFDLTQIPPLPPTFVNACVLEDVRLNYLHGSICLNNVSVLGHLPKHIVNVLFILTESHEQNVSVELRCIITRVDDQRKKTTKAAFFSELRATMSAIIYGPLLHFKKIGDFLEECDICLQDPLGGCERNVRYRNPHKYSGLDANAPWTMDRDLMVPETRMVHQDMCSGCMDDFNFQGTLPEAPVPQALRTELRRHQRQGLFFMLERERGWSYMGDLKDIWKATTVSGLLTYRNTVNDDVQLKPPRQFRGGLLFDDMGLGKTLTVIALAASDLEMRIDLQAHGQRTHTRCTLAIVPPQLLGMWEEQLSRHVHPGRLRWCKHHGSHRLAQLSQLKDYDIVLTTYNTVAAEFKSHPAMSKGVLLQAHWHRIVLDEAQEIRDPRTQAAKAIRKLNADRRWAVSGTPIQNHLSDFKALLQYLRASPYDDPAAFERDINKVWKTDHECAIRNLKHIITSLALRRSRDAVELSPRTHSDTFLNFSPDERELYEPLETRITSLLYQAKDATETTTRMNALQGLNALRLVCNFGTLSDKKYLTAFSTTSSWSRADAQETFNSLVTANEAFCSKCLVEVVRGSTSSDIASTEVYDVVESQPLISTCGKVLCANCSRKTQHSLESTFNWCGCFSACPVHVVGSGRSSSEFNHRSLHHLSLSEFPTKIRALISNLQAFPNSKSVVFSSWRTTLDLCTAGLTLAKIPFVRFDGQVNGSERVNALSNFRADPKIKVILFTISCGAVGLDLTAADRAYLMEPQWNPTLENQAFARVHRMGQTKPVTTVRFIMNLSYEEHVVEVQKQKKTFSDFLLNGKRPNGLRGGGAAFETFRRLISRR